MKIKKLVWMLLFPFVISCAGNKKDSAQNQFELWIDVRTHEEFAAGHLDGAINIPHDAIGKRISEVAPDKNQTIRLYCRSGRRSEIAKTTLEVLGYTNVSNEGAYKDLKNRQ